MTSIRATVRGRRLEVNVPPDWPDGAEVEIHPVQDSRDGAAMSPEEIAATLAAMEQITPLEMTETERAAWEAERRARREREKSEFAKHIGKLRSDWE